MEEDTAQLELQNEILEERLQYLDDLILQRDREFDALQKSVKELSLNHDVFHQIDSALKDVKQALQSSAEEEECEDFGAEDSTAIDRHGVEGLMESLSNGSGLFDGMIESSQQNLNWSEGCKSELKWMNELVIRLMQASDQLNGELLRFHREVWERGDGEFSESSIKWYLICEDLEKKWMKKLAAIEVNMSKMEEQKFWAKIDALLFRKCFEKTSNVVKHPNLMKSSKVSDREFIIVKAEYEKTIRDSFVSYLNSSKCCSKNSIYRALAEKDDRKMGILKQKASKMEIISQVLSDTQARILLLHLAMFELIQCVQEQERISSAILDTFGTSSRLCDSI